MSTPQFAIAKFIPDMKRMEPRNFGVVVWNSGDCIGRFVGDDKARDARALAGLRIPDRTVYLQWIDYWRAQMGRPAIRLKTGVVVPRTEADFLSALCDTSLENFRLNSAGLLSEHVPASQTGAIAQSLYDELVVAPRSHDRSKEKEIDISETLRKETNKAIEASGLSEVPGFRRSYDWLCPVGDTLQHFKFHYAVHNTRPEAVLQKVNLHRQSSVNDAAFMFQAMQQQKYFGKDRCAAVVYADDADLKENDVYQSFKLMGGLSRLINVADESHAIREFGAMAI